MGVSRPCILVVRARDTPKSFSKFPFLPREIGHELKTPTPFRPNAGKRVQAGMDVIPNNFMVKKEPETNSSCELLTPDPVNPGFGAI